ncbi:MAG: Crp/Fnr family transcriptional regulator [Oceanicaulis sp.]
MKALIERLERAAELSAEDRDALAGLRLRRRRFERGAVVRRCDEANRHLFCVEDGWAVRCRILHDGQRQILAILMPGDVCDLQAIVGAEHDHHIIALTDLQVAECPAAQFEALIASHEALAKAFLLGKVQDDSMMREHVVRLGRRKARERVVHLLVEMCERQRLGGAPTPWRLAYPLNRETLADALGLSPVHVSRSLAALSRAGVVSIQQGCITLSDPAAAAALCGYDPAYLHAGGEAA